MQGDDSARADALAEKIVKLRIFKDDLGKMNLSLRYICGSALIISQFTLAAELNGNRPGFTSASPADVGKRLYENFIHMMQNKSVNVATGVFGADMDVSLNNDGPVTIWMDV